MFKKSFRIKTSTQVKTSERKILKELFLKRFSKLTDADIDAIFPKKDIVVCMKIVTADNTTLQTYLIQKRVIAFEHNGVLYPSVYLLWKYPDILPTFTTNSYVASKLNGGADLMIPGLIGNPSINGSFLAKEPACVNLHDNKAAVAVGVTAMSSAEINRSQGKGKCVIIYHLYGDKLCTIDDMPLLPFPQLGASLQLNDEDNDTTSGIGDTDVSESANDESDVVTVSDILENESSVECSLTDINETEEMDKLLIDCFLTAIKYSKTLILPMLTSSFYKLEVMTVCPPEKNLNIKKSSYKKVGQFLKQMSKDGIIVIAEKKKGVETLEQINTSHPTFLNFYVEVGNRPKKPAEETTDGTPAPNIVESYCITKAVEPIFAEFGLKKNDSLTTTEIRKYITEYVKTHNYQSENNRKFVNIAETPLSSICKNEVAVTWEELMSKICSSMTTCFTVTKGMQKTVSKGKQPIMMKVQTRSGNKKVTLIDNLEIYGINITEFSKECQHGVAASTSTSRPPGNKTDQLLVQGNQVLFVHNLLTEKYKIPKTYIRGLEFAPKKK